MSSRIRAAQGDHNLLGTDLGTWKLDMPRAQFITVVKADLDAVCARMREAQIV